MNSARGLQTSVMPYLKKLCSLVAVSAIFCTLGTSAKALIVSASNSGWYDSDGGSNGTSSNIAQFPGAFRNWLGFDLSSVSGTITGATLEVGSVSNNASGQTINWYDVLTPYANLGISSLATYDDLGSGALFASGIHTAGTTNYFTLNAAALASLNSTSSFWAIGGDNGGPGYAFGYTSGVGQDHIKLNLTIGSANVPDHAPTLALVGFGFLALAVFRRKKSA